MYRVCLRKVGRHIEVAESSSLYGLQLQWNAFAQYLHLDSSFAVEQSSAKEMVMALKMARD